MKIVIPRYSVARRIAAVVIGAVWMAGLAELSFAHGIRSTVAMEQAVVVRLQEDDGTPFAGKHAEIFGPGDTAPFLDLKTDAAGVLAFHPDRSGAWRVRVYSNDGHGVDIKIDTRELDMMGREGGTGRVGGERYSQLALGVGVILSIFGGVALWRLRSNA